MGDKTNGQKFREAVASSFPLQIVGTMNAYVAMMAKQVGFKAIYLSGAGVANSCYGLPDLGMTSLDNVLDEARKIIQAANLPLLVDIDTGWGGTLVIEHTIKRMEEAGVAAVHLEDQPLEKRCGHRPNKSVVSKELMISRLKAALDARQDDSFVIMARTDAYQSEGLGQTLERCLAYEEAGADMHFIEALTSLEDYQTFKKALKKPILANLTEFGKTPLFSREELASVGVDIILYPLSANRAMNLAALKVFNAILKEGSQKDLVDQMQTREELYHFLDYEKYEQQIDRQMF